MFYLLFNPCFLFSISGNNNETRDQTFSSLNSNKNNKEVLEKSKEKSKQTQNIVNNSVTTQSMSTSTNKTIIDLNNISISKPVDSKKEELVQKFFPQLEIIPKPEPLSDVEEETDTSSETEEFNRNNKPFLLVSEYLSQTKAFSQYMTNNNENYVCNDSTFEKSIDIDLNKESDHDSNNESLYNIESIFNNEIIDLTPKTSAKKSNAKSKPKSKQLKCKLFSNLNSILKEF